MKNLISPSIVAITACLFAQSLAAARDSNVTVESKYELPLRHFQQSEHANNIYSLLRLAIPDPRREDWQAISIVITFSPSKAIDDEYYATLTSDGKKFYPGWSKSEARAISACLATIHRACPKLVSRFTDQLIIKKVPGKSAADNLARCYVRDKTFYFTEDFFDNHYENLSDKPAVTLDVCTALVANSGDTESLSRHRDWSRIIQRPQKARAFCAEHFNLHDLKLIDHHIATNLIAPGLLCSAHPKAALEQTLAKYLLTNARGTPLEGKKFLSAALEDKAESLQNFTFTQAEIQESEGANSPENFNNFALSVLSSTREENKRSRVYQMHLAQYWLDLAKTSKFFTSEHCLKEALDALDDNLEETNPRNEQEKLLRASILYELGLFTECRADLTAMKQTNIVRSLANQISKLPKGTPNKSVMAAFNKEFKRTYVHQNLVVKGMALEQIANAYDFLLNSRTRSAKDN